MVATAHSVAMAAVQDTDRLAAVATGAVLVTVHQQAVATEVVDTTLAVVPVMGVAATAAT